MTTDQLVDTLRRIIRKYLPDPAYKTFIFGSRAENTNRKFSDVDLGILGPAPIPNSVLSNIEDDLEESDIPYLVDIVDFTQANEGFKKIATSVTISI